MKLFKQHEAFLKEFAKLQLSSEFVRVETDSLVLNNLTLIATIILNDDMKTEAEKCLQNYIEIFFKRMDGVEQPNSVKNDVIEDQFDEEDDLVSQYSTLSSMLGIQLAKLNNFFMEEIIC